MKIIDSENLIWILSQNPTVTLAEMIGEKK